jgi:subtilisin family serine protease
VREAGGRVVRENRAVGVATVRSAQPGFARDLRRDAAIDGVAADRSIGRAPAQRPKRDRVELASLVDEEEAQVPSPPLAPLAEPFSTVQWDMAMIDADRTGSLRVEQGSRDVRVGVIDTGIEGLHPDIAPNFNAGLSRNFTRDDPTVDGPCASDPDGWCTDPADVDEAGHGTHVAGTIAAPLNGVGIGGVAPGVELVNRRAGQDSGFFFLQPTVDALTYAGDNGVDIVNMSFYIDPWLYNCAGNPADSPAAQAEQRTIIEATQRALAYARVRGVTLVSALGNQGTDLGAPTTDASSPDFPPGAAYPRTVDNSCLTLPAEGDGVLGISAVGPQRPQGLLLELRVQQTDLSAPGGDARDFPGTSRPGAPENRILAPYPEIALRAAGEIGEDGTPTTPLVLGDCVGGRCFYWRYLQGTSMASPHPAGVAALVVASRGEQDPEGGLTLRPRRVERVLRRTATDVPCPEPALLTYPGLPASYDATCEGPQERNGFYGDGIVNALRAVRALDAHPRARSSAAVAAASTTVTTKGAPRHTARAATARAGSRASSVSPPSPPTVCTTTSAARRGTATRASSASARGEGRRSASRSGPAAFRA